MRTRSRTTTAAAALTAALALTTLTACSDDDSDTNNANDQATENNTDDTGNTPAPDQPAGATSDDLAPGDSYTWDNDLTVTVDNIREVPDTDIGEFDFIPDGHLPFVADVTITNDSDTPYDLAGLQPNAEGATQGGDAPSASFDSINAVGHYEGRLAPGETLETVRGWTIDEEHGREVVIEAFRNDDWNLTMPTWVGSIAPAE